MNKLLVIFYVFFANILFAQNLVPNSSFEDTLSCPLGTNDPQALATWFNPTMATPDYYNSCANNGAGVPSNDWGYQFAQEGQAYIGLCIYGDHPIVSNYREYMEVQLLDSLISGLEYFWCMHVSLLDSTNYASNNIGISLTNNSIINSSSEEMLVTTITDNYDHILLDNKGWTQISGSFIANGGEKFLTIGNFYSDENTDFIEVMDSSINGDFSYYFIDNVYLGLQPCVDPDILVPNVFTPNNDNVNDVLTFAEINGVSNFSIRIVNRWGNTVYYGQNELFWDGTNSTGELVAEGIYFYVLEYNDDQIKKGFVQVVK